MEKKYESPAIIHAKNRARMKNYLIGAATVLTAATLTYFAFRGNNDTPKDVSATYNNIPAIVIGDGNEINAPITVIQNVTEIGDGSAFVITAPYAVGINNNSCDSCYTVTNPADSLTKKVSVEEKQINKKHKKHENKKKEKIISIDDCVSGQDLFQNPTMLNDLQNVLYENQK